MSHNPETGRPQPHRRLTADQHEDMTSWPHTPSPELFNRAASITTTLRQKGTLSASSWRPAYALDSFVALPSAKRFPGKN